MNLIDRRAVLARVDGDEGLLREIISIFLEYAPQRREAIRTAIENGDFASLGRIAHAFKGSVGYLDAAPVAEVLQQLEQLAVSADAERLPEALAVFERLLHNLISEATAFVRADGVSDNCHFNSETQL